MKPIIVNLDDDRKAKKRNKIVQNRRRSRMVPEENDQEMIDDWEDTVQVLALDPGGTTGWSLFEVLPGALSDRPEHRGVGVLNNVIRWRHGQIDCGTSKGNLGRSLHSGVSTSGENAGIGEILGLIRSWPLAAIVVEDFILDPNRFNTGRDLLSPVRITSGVSYDLWLQGRDYFSQTASLAKSSVKDESLKLWGFYDRTGGLGHARDADRHALTFLRRASEISAKGFALRKTAWPHLFDVGKEYGPVSSKKASGNASAKRDKEKAS